MTSHTYRAGEAAALALIQALSAWDTSNSVSLANDENNIGMSMVNSGASSQYCFLSPGPFESGYENIGESLVIDRWQTVITLAVFVVQDLSDPSSPEMRLATLRQNIIDALDKRFALSGSASFAKVISGTEISNFTTAELGPFILQEMTLLWEAERDLTQAD